MQYLTNTFDAMLDQLKNIQRTFTTKILLLEDCIKSNKTQGIVITHITPRSFVEFNSNSRILDLLNNRNLFLCSSSLFWKRTLWLQNPSKNGRGIRKPPDSSYLFILLIDNLQHIYKYSRVRFGVSFKHSWKTYCLINFSSKLHYPVMIPQESY